VIYGHVVVGTDGSSTAEEAVQQAAVLARATGAPLLVVAAYRRPSQAELGPPSQQAQSPSAHPVSSGYQGAADHAQDGAGMARRVAPDVTVETITPEGDAADALLDAAEQRESSLLVVGSQGMTGSSRYLLGSVPNKVTHHAPGDVLVVRTGGQKAAETPQRMLVATDGSRTAGRALNRALALAGAIGSDVTVLTVTDDKSQAEKVLADAEERAKEVGVVCQTVRERGNAADAILGAGEDHDLVVVGNKGMTGAARFLLGSVPNKVSHHLTTDLLIVRTTS
jgi:nucleotide-binding universal stress UspA family protein